MICQNCGTENRDEQKFCKSCGASLIQAQPPQFQVKICPVCGCEMALNSTVCNACGYDEANAYIQEQPEQEKGKKKKGGTAPVTTIGQYMGWTILYMIPFIGFIFTIVFAAMGSHKNRANFFRALLIWNLIILVIGIIAIVIIVVAGASLPALLSLIVSMFVPSSNIAYTY